MVTVCEARSHGGERDPGSVGTPPTAVSGGIAAMDRALCAVIDGGIVLVGLVDRGAA